MREIRVFIADDHAIVRDGLERLIGGADGLTVVGMVSDSGGVQTALHEIDFDVLILDLSLPGVGGVELLAQVKQHKPLAAVVIFTMHPEDRFAVRLMRAGAHAYINKSRPARELLEAIRKVAQGGRYVTPVVGELLLSADAGEAHPHENLTDREYQLLLLLLDGKQPSDIALELELSASTVSTHIRHIKDKLGAQSVADLVRYGFRAGLIDD